MRVHIRDAVRLLLLERFRLIKEGPEGTSIALDKAIAYLHVCDSLKLRIVRKQAKVFDNVPNDRVRALEFLQGLQEERLTIEEDPIEDDSDATASVN